MEKREGSQATMQTKRLMVGKHGCTRKWSKGPGARGLLSLGTLIKLTPPPYSHGEWHSEEWLAAVHSIKTNQYIP